MNSSSVDRSFVHLHVHSHYSLRDGVASIEELTEQAAALEMKALALTDHNTLAGMVSFFEACDVRGIRPIPGVQIDCVPWPDLTPRSISGSIVLLVESEIGYRNLTRLVSLANRKVNEGLAPHVTNAELAEHAGGLIALVGVSSPLRHFIKPPDAARIEEYLTDLVRIFGRQNLFFELLPPSGSRQRSLNEYFIQLGDFLGIEIVATNDVHYVWPEDELARLFRAGETPPQVIGKHARELGEGRRHLAAMNEMRDWFAFVPQALANAAAIAERCQFRPELRRRRLLDHDFARGFDAESHLWDLVFRCATDRFGELDEDLKSRLNHEFDYLTRHGLANYFLLLWRLASFMEEQRIPCLVRRGAITHSLIAYVLGLTGLDPLQYNLGFEPLVGDRHVFPEVTLQVASRHVEALLQHLEQTYGAERMARVGRHQYWQRKQLLSELCRWVGLPRAKADALIAADAIPAHSAQPYRWATLFRNGAEAVATHHPSALGYIFSRLDPLPRGLATQGHRLVLCGQSIDGVASLAWPGREGATTQLDAGDCDALGLPRLNLTTNRSLDVLDEAVMWVRRERNEKFDIDDISDSDPETFRLFGQGRTVGIPGFEGVVMRSLLRRESPSTLKNLIRVRMAGQGGKQAGAETPPGTLVADCLLAYRCGYIKARYPVSFYSALLTHVCQNASESNSRRLARVLREMQQEGVRLLPPDINLSTYNFNQVGERIRTGLIVIRQMGEKAASEIAAVRRGGEFHSLLDFCRRTDPKRIHHRLIENLIKAGAMDCFGLRRSQMLALLDLAFGQTRQSPAKPADAMQMEFDFQPIATDDLEQEFEPPDLPELPLHLRLQYEIQAAGHPFSADLLKPYDDLLMQCRFARAPIRVSPRSEGHDMYLAGMPLQMETAGPGDPESPGWWIDFDGNLIAVPERLFESHKRDLRGSDPLMIGATVVKRADDCYLRAHSITTLVRLHQQASQARRLVLDLQGQGKPTIKTVRQLCGQFPGPTRLRCLNYEAPLSFGLRRIESIKVTVCPPLLNSLRKVLGPQNVNVQTYADEEEEESPAEGREKATVDSVAD